MGNTGITIVRTKRTDLKDHIAHPASVNMAESGAYIIVMCGKGNVEAESVNTFDSVKEARDKYDICKNCLCSAGIIPSPKLND